MNVKIKSIALALAAAGLLGSQVALADQIELSNFWSGSGSASITFNGTNYHDNSSASFAETGGSGGFKTYDLTTDPGRTNSFQSWCVDIFHSFSFAITSTDTYKTASSIFGATKATDLGRLYTNEHTLIDGTNSAADSSAAFQLAVWEIVNEGSGSYNLSNGNLQISSGSTGYGTAQTWLSALNNTPSTSQYNVNIWSVTSNAGPSGSGAQDVAVFTSAVPEPDTYAMLLAGLGLMGFIARRRKSGSFA